MEKILAVASTGGHWVQLLRLTPAFNFDNAETIFMSTKEASSDMVQNSRFCLIPDCNRSNKMKIFYTFFVVFLKIVKIKPQVIVTTGAAPGLMAIISGKIIGIRTVWIDSIANVERVSLSGRIARFFADRVYTQWSHLATAKIIFNGNVL